MAAEDQDSRTEDPTGKRQSEALKQGNVALSREVGFVIMLLSTLTVMLVVAPWSFRPLLAMLRGFIEQPEKISLASRSDILALWYRVGIVTALATAPPIVLFLLTGIGGTIAQLGQFLWATEKLKLKWDAFSPVSGLKRLFGFKAFIEWGKGLAKLAIVGLVTYWVLRPEYRHIELLVGVEPSVILRDLSSGLRRLLLTLIGVMIVIAGADLAYQRWSHWRTLKMTKQEVKDEVKNADGDPAIKGKQRARRQARARQRMLKSVATASVVVTNPTHYAVALSYEKGMNAPKLAAKGMDHLARRIREIAEAHDVPIVENPPVARAIHASVEIDEEIPPEQYKAVAEIISYVMRLKRVTAPG